MCSEVPRYIKVAAILGLFSDLMKFTGANESLSINNLMFWIENNSTVSIKFKEDGMCAQKCEPYKT